MSICQSSLFFEAEWNFRKPQDIASHGTRGYRGMWCMYTNFESVTRKSCVAGHQLIRERWYRAKQLQRDNDIEIQNCRQRKAQASIRGLVCIHWKMNYITLYSGGARWSSAVLHKLFQAVDRNLLYIFVRGPPMAGLCGGLYAQNRNWVLVLNKVWIMGIHALCC